MLSSIGNTVSSILLSFTSSTSCITHLRIRLLVLFLQSIPFKLYRFISQYGLILCLTWTNGLHSSQVYLCSWPFSSCIFILTESLLWWIDFSVPLALLLPLCTIPTTSTHVSIMEGLRPFGTGSVIQAITVSRGGESISLLNQSDLTHSFWII